MMDLWLSLIASFIAFACLVRVLRSNCTSLGLPAAYLAILLLLHAPGAFAHAVGGHKLLNTDLVTVGMGLTALGASSFVVGVWFARWRGPSAVIRPSSYRQQFCWFCLISGWFFTYGLDFLRSIPTVGAAVEKSGAVWMLGVSLGLRMALVLGNASLAATWLGALAVYPTLMLLFGGFLGYGSRAIIIVLSGLIVTVRSATRAALGIAIVGFLGFNVFLNYFQHRNEIRDAVWEAAPIGERVDVSLRMIREFQWFDSSNETQLGWLDDRLNQNYFVGLAAARIADGEVDYLHGRSVWEGLLALVPRIWWPEKPVFGGSPRIVSEMTGLTLSDTTSWGVGNVMEFHINFGIPGVVIGFLLLGWLIGRLDRSAAVADGEGNFGRVITCFLPAVGLIQPGGSVVELAGGSAIGWLASFAWSWAWRQWAGLERRGGKLRSQQPAHHGTSSLPATTTVHRTR